MTDQPPSPTTGPSAMPQSALNAVIKALLLNYVLPSADPLSTSITLTASQLKRAANHTLTIRSQPQSDIQPEPYIIIIVEGS
jgi:hypothetical protein